MKTNLIFWLTIILLIVSNHSEAQVKKYDIKSGIITFESIMKMGNFEVKDSIKVYFDDYGMKECKETYKSGKLEESFLSDGKNLFLLKPQQKTAYNRGTAYRGTELCVEWSEFGTEKDRKSGKYKKLPSQKIVGKDCDMFQYDNGKGTITQYGGWNKIMLYMEVKTKGLESIQRAIKVEENVNVSPVKFTVPKDYKIE